jgi:hypothetical protein
MGILNGMDFGSMKDRALAIATMQTWVMAMAAVFVILLVAVGIWYAGPTISKMTSRKREYNIDEEELDRLIESIHERQMPDGSRKRVK